MPNLAESKACVGDLAEQKRLEEKNVQDKPIVHVSRCKFALLAEEGDGRMAKTQYSPRMTGAE